MIDQIENCVREVFQITFPEANMELFTRQLSVGDIPEWDSIGNFNFLLALEAEFGVQFDIDQMSALKDIQSILDILKNLVKA
ncbi:hypothetical protein N8446_08810 [Planktomarina temperata]|nr:hypothetical protein [Planktomarina temperata]